MSAIRQRAIEGLRPGDTFSVSRTFTDELTATFDVTDETWAALAAHYAAPKLVEILYVVGQYTMLSMVANAAGVPA